MVCPFCNNEMIKGKIFGNARRKLQWVPEDEKLILGVWSNNAITLKNQTGTTGNYQVKAFACKKCKKLIADLL